MDLGLFIDWSEFREENMRSIVVARWVGWCVLVGTAALGGCGGNEAETTPPDSGADALDGSSVPDVDDTDSDSIDAPDADDADGADDDDSDSSDDADTGDTDTGDTDEPNACGSTGPLIWEGASVVPGDACACGGFIVCSEAGVDCVGERAPNACGGCDEIPADRTLGEECGPCSGQVWICDGSAAVVCSPTTQAQNACGGCGTLDGSPLELCDSDDGAGLWVCTSEDTVRCLGAGRNDCGGLEVLDGSVGAPCGDCGQGRLVCDGRDALTCRGGAGGENACGGCAPLAGDPGESCGTCSGVWECDPDADRVICSQPSRNACGGCTPLEGGPGDTCTDGVTFCEGASALGCGPATLNACGGRGSLDARPGSACGPCGDGVNVCAGRDRVVCVDATPLNSCGSCERLAGEPGSTCAFNHTWQCGDGDNVQCRLARQTGVVDAAGGTVRFGDQVTLDADSGAVDAPTGITIELSELTSIPGYEVTSPVFRFLPEGLEFQIPITIRMSTRDTDDVDMWWSQRASEGDGYDAQASTLDGNIVEAQVDHFSIGFVGRYIGADACTSDIDGDSCSTGLGGACEAGTLTCRAGEAFCEPTAAGCDGGGTNDCGDGADAGDACSFDGGGGDGGSVSACGDDGVECSRSRDCIDAGLENHDCDAGCCVQLPPPACVRPLTPCESDSQTTNSFVCDTDAGLCLTRCASATTLETRGTNCPTNSYCFQTSELEPPIDEFTGDRLDGICLPGDCDSGFNETGAPDPTLCDGITSIFGDNPICADGDCWCSPLANGASFCSPGGTRQLGETCGTTDDDLCESGLSCAVGLCVEPCSLDAADSCAGGGPLCAPGNSCTCLDVTDTSGSNRPGVCSAECDPFSADACGDDALCTPTWGRFGVNGWICRPRNFEALIAIGDSCDSTNGVYGTCEEGALCLADSSDVPEVGTCAAVCDPLGVSAGDNADCGGSEVCAPLNNPEELGQCVQQCEPFPRRAGAPYPGCEDPTDVCFPFVQRDDRAVEPVAGCYRPDASDTGAVGDTCPEPGFIGGGCADYAVCLAARAGDTVGECVNLCENFVDRDDNCPDGQTCGGVQPLLGNLSFSFCSVAGNPGREGDRCSNAGSTCAEDGTICIGVTTTTNECVKVCRAGFSEDCGVGTRCSTGVFGGAVPSFMGICL
jgi:hypothetical protein